MYKKGDVGVPADKELFLKFKARTDELVEIHGGLKSHKFAWKNKDITTPEEMFNFSRVD